MTTKTYKGSCHCGAVRYEVDVDLASGSYRCNCSICKKARAWFVPVPPERFRHLSGKENESEYRWTPPGRDEPFLHYRFCKTCGVRTVGHGGLGTPKAFHFVAVASLDDVDPADIPPESIHFNDGASGHFERPAPNAAVL